MPLTISALSQACGLSRSTLLYYDRIGLLRPSARSPAGYRLYAEAERARLRQICIYRDAGVPLARIGTLLHEAAAGSARASLLGHMDELNRRIEALREQRTRVLTLLGSARLPAQPTLLPVQDMVAILRSAGLNDAGLDRLHASFEQSDPAAHQRFLESLGLAPERIEQVRAEARACGKP